MPRRNGSFTRGERIFVDALAKTGDAHYAAAAAGYAHPDKMASAKSRDPAIIKAAREIAQIEISGDIVPLAIAAHRRLLSDPKTPASALNQAIATAYKYGLAASDGDVGDKDPAEMTASELATLRDRLLVELSNRAVVVIDQDAPAPAPAGGIFG